MTVIWRRIGRNGKDLREELELEYTDEMEEIEDIFEAEEGEEGQLCKFNASRLKIGPQNHNLNSRPCALLVGRIDQKGQLSECLNFASSKPYFYGILTSPRPY